jgi:hypothetical protein
LQFQPTTNVTLKGGQVMKCLQKALHIMISIGKYNNIMAEVFGIIAGALGALDVSKRGIDRIDHVCSRWRNAPQELLELRNEVQDLRVVLDQIMEAKTTIETTSQQDAPFAAALDEQYKKANDSLTGLEDILDDLNGIKGYKKKYKWVRKEGKIDAMKMQIRRVRQTISSLLLTHGV